MNTDQWNFDQLDAALEDNKTLFSGLSEQDLDDVLAGGLVIQEGTDEEQIEDIFSDQMMADTIMDHSYCAFPMNEIGQQCGKDDETKTSDGNVSSSQEDLLPARRSTRVMERRQRNEAQRIQEENRQALKEAGDLPAASRIKGKFPVIKSYNMRTRKPDDCDKLQEVEQGDSFSHVQENDLMKEMPDPISAPNSLDDCLNKITVQQRNIKEDNVLHSRKKNNEEKNVNRATDMKNSNAKPDTCTDSGSSEEDVPLKEFIGKDSLDNQENSGSDDIPLQQIKRLFNRSKRKDTARVSKLTQYRKKRGRHPVQHNRKNKLGIDKAKSGKKKIKTMAMAKSIENDDLEPTCLADEENESDADQDRLWCICRKPYNNRFMIHCDKCLEWFHGTCVGVTKKQGKTIEKHKLDWVCPKCSVKKQTDEDTSKSVKSQDEKMKKSRELTEGRVKQRRIKQAMEVPPKKLKKVAVDTKHELNKCDSGDEFVSRKDGLMFDNSCTLTVKKEPEKTEHEPDQAIDDDEPGVVKAANDQRQLTMEFSKEHETIHKIEVEHKYGIMKVEKNPGKNDMPVDDFDEDIRRKNGKKELRNEVGVRRPVNIIGKTKVKKGVKREAKQEKHRPPSQKRCILENCKGQTVQGWIYCSEDCIAKHAQESIRLIHREKTKVFGNKPEAMRSSVDRIMVFERSTGKFVTGPMAPTEKTLQAFLKKYPTFEVVQPGNLPITKLRKEYKLQKLERMRKENSQKQERSRKHDKSAQERFLYFAKSNQSEKNGASDETSAATAGDISNTGPDPVRLSVRKSLKDALNNRANDSEDIMLTGGEIKKLAVTIEEEMFKFYGSVSTKKKKVPTATLR